MIEVVHELTMEIKGVVALGSLVVGKRFILIEELRNDNRGYGGIQEHVLRFKANGQGRCGMVDHLTNGESSRYVDMSLETMVIEVRC